MLERILSCLTLLLIAIINLITFPLILKFLYNFAVLKGDYIIYTNH